MAKNKIKTKLPQNMTISEASEFWDEHHSFEFQGTEEVDVEFKLRKKQYIGITYEVYHRLKNRAEQLKITPEELLESLIAENIRQN